MPNLVITSTTGSALIRGTIKISCELANLTHRFNRVFAGTARLARDSEDANRKGLQTSTVQF
jgi:hypothetical protein